jgi:hypothetical protein
LKRTLEATTASKVTSLPTCSKPRAFNIITNIRWSWAAWPNIPISQSKTIIRASPTTGNTADFFTTPPAVDGGTKSSRRYRNQQILPLKEDGGPQGTLIVTRDEENGGIDSTGITKLIEEVFDV